MPSPIAGLRRAALAAPRFAGMPRIKLDWFVMTLVLVIATATALPCSGTSAEILRAIGMLAISTLFFLQGARLSREAILNGITHWRLHATISAITFVMFPLLGLVISFALSSLLPPVLWLGVLFVCVLPSTVQSSIALTSMAQGNVAGAVCSATLSNITGIALTPLLFGIVASAHGGSVDVNGVCRIVLQLLVPFVAGHLARPYVGVWVQRNRGLLSVTDRGSILLVCYTAFSAAVVHGIWQQVPPATFALVCAIAALLFLLAFLSIIAAARMLRLPRQDEAAAVFCGSQKSLVAGVPMANALFAGSSIGPVLLPMLIYYPLELLFCAWLARRYAGRSEREDAPGPRGRIFRRRSLATKIAART